MITEELKKLYIAHTGHEPEAIDELPSSGPAVFHRRTHLGRTGY